MSLLPLIALATLGGVFGLAGGTIFIFNDKLKNILTNYSVPFAAGILLTVALLDLIPEAVAHNGEVSYLLVLVTFFMVFSFEHLFFSVHHHDCDRASITPGAVPLVIAGDTIHNFIDGVAIASAYMVDPAFGVVVAISSFLHEVPHEIGDFGVLLAAGWKRSKVVLVNMLSASSTYLGVLFVYFYAQHNESLIGTLLAVSAGLFLYLGASDFLPGRGKNNEPSASKVLTVVVGATIMIFISLLLPHAD